MKRLSTLLVLSFFLLLGSSFITIDKKTVNVDNDFCENVKKITEAFNNKEFEKIKGKAIEDETAPNDKQYVSAVNLKGYISQIVYETEKEVSFAAVLNEDYESADALMKQLENLSSKLGACLELSFEYSESKNFHTYTFVFDSGVEVKLSGNYPTEKRRYINLEISYKKG